MKPTNFVKLAMGFCCFVSSFAMAADITLTAARGGEHGGETITSTAFPDYRFDEKTLTHTAVQMLSMALMTEGVDFEPTLVNAMNETLSDDERLNRVISDCSDLVLDIHLDSQLNPPKGHGMTIYVLSADKVGDDLATTTARATQLGNALLGAWLADGQVATDKTVRYADTPLLRNPQCPTLLINLDSNRKGDETWFVQPQSIVYRMQHLAHAIKHAMDIAL